MNTTANRPAEVNYRETQYGVRHPDGRILLMPIGPAEAERHRAAGIDLRQRERVVFYDDVTEWAEMPEPFANRIAAKP